MRRGKKGFTLIELLVVMAIIAIIAAVAVPVVIGQIDKSKKKSDAMFFESINDSVYTTISNRNSSNYGKIKLGDVLTTMYQTQGGEFNPADPCASILGNSPYPILPATLPVGKAYPASGKFIVVRLIRVTEDVGGNPVERPGYEVVMFDADNSNAILHSARVSFGKTFSITKFSVDEHCLEIVAKPLALTDSEKAEVGKDISLTIRNS